MKNIYAILARLLLGLTVLSPAIAKAQWCNTNLYTSGCASFGDAIQSFSTTGGMANITNNNTGCTNINATAYSYYSGTGKTHTALAGTTGNFSFTNNPNYSEWYGIWIDFDNNGSFADPGEQVYASTGAIAASATITGSFTVPSNATAGTSRMRIRCVFGSAPTDCANFYEGEAEDYDFVIISPSCDPPANFQFSNIGINKASVNWDPAPNAVQYEYLLDTNPGDPTSSGYNYTSATNLNFTNLLPNTCYYLHMRTLCASTSQSPVSSWVVDSFCTIPDCDPPVVTISNVTSTTAIASWDAVLGAYGYEYAVSVISTPPTAGNQTLYTAVKLLGLESNKTWYFHVRAKCSPVPLSTWVTTPFHTAATLGVDNAATGNFMLNAYPNPVKNILRVEMTTGQTGLARVYITDVAGRMVKDIKMDKKVTDIDVSNLVQGMYLLHYKDDANTQVIKLLKE